MKIIQILPILLVLPSVVFGATRGDSAARVGMSRGSQAGARMSVGAADVQAVLDKAANAKEEAVEDYNEEKEEIVVEKNSSKQSVTS